MSPGMHSLPHPEDPPVERDEQVPDVPAEEHLDPATIDEDLAEKPEEKVNATEERSDR